MITIADVGMAATVVVLVGVALWGAASTVRQGNQHEAAQQRRRDAMARPGAGVPISPIVRRQVDTGDILAATSIEAAQDLRLPGPTLDEVTDAAAVLGGGGWSHDEVADVLAKVGADHTVLLDPEDVPRPMADGGLVRQSPGIVETLRNELARVIHERDQAEMISGVRAAELDLRPPPDPILRFVHDRGPVEPQRVAAEFGITDAELETRVAHLVAMGQVEIDGDPRVYRWTGPPTKPFNPYKLEINQ